MSDIGAWQHVAPSRPVPMPPVAGDLRHEAEPVAVEIVAPGGTLGARQLLTLAALAERHAGGRARLTARQGIRLAAASAAGALAIRQALGEIGLEPLPAEGALVDTVVSDDGAGAAFGEVADPRPWHELLRGWLARQPGLTRPRRGFRLLVTGGPPPADAVARRYDLVLTLGRDETGEPGFTALAGGSFGAGGALGAPGTGEELLASLAGLARAYARLAASGGRRVARARARAQGLGLADFARLAETGRTAVEAAAAQAMAGMARLRARFAPPTWEALPAFDALHEQRAAAVEPFGRWARQRTARHKAPGYRIVTAPVRPGGEATAAQLRTAAELAEEFGHGEARLTRGRGLALPHVRQRDLFALWHLLDDAGLAGPGGAIAEEAIHFRNLPAA